MQKADEVGNFSVGKKIQYHWKLRKRKNRCGGSQDLCMATT
jgi:hypothetical protein